MINIAYHLLHLKYETELLRERFIIEFSIETLKKNKTRNGNIKYLSN